MRCVACAVFVLALSACGEDPSLRVQVHLERPPVHQLVVSVYESPSVTCEQIEYADLTEAQLDALLVDEQTITGDEVEGTLDNLSRTDRKLIVARAYSATGELLEGGCQGHDLVVENDSVTVKTHVIASVSAEVVLDNAGLPVDPLRIGVIVTDRDGVPLEDRPVSWRMIGPAGSDEIQSTNITPTGDGTWQPTEPACTGEKGTTPIYPVTPNLVGGFATAVRAAWANQVATQFSGITNTGITSATPPLTDLAIPAETKRPCAVSVKRSGTMLVKRLVCVDGAFAREFSVTLANGVATLVSSPPAPLARAPVALFALPGESDASQSEVYAVDKDGRVTALFGATPAQTVQSCPNCADNIVDAMVAPACGPRDTAKLLLVVREGSRDSVKVMPPRGGIAIDVGLAPPDEVSIAVVLRNAGCVAAIGASGYEERQLTVVDLIVPASGPTQASITRGFYGCSPTSSCKRVVLPVAEAAIGFTKTTPPYLIGTATDATGIVLATWGLIADPNDPTTDRLVERAPRVASSMLPNRIAIGTFDEDDGPDMIWDLPRGMVGRGGTSLELAYSSLQGIRLQALSNPLALSVLDVLATDVTHDDHDDIIIVANRSVGSGGVMVVPTHAIGRPKSIPVETTCGGP
jgi:hypothetical protein